jgi:hypothetical protein
MSDETFCAIVDDGKVVNIIVIAEGHDLFNHNPNWVFIGKNDNRIAIGWTYDGITFAPAQPNERA